MIKISKKADYAVLIMASLASRQAAHEAKGDLGDKQRDLLPASAHDIADENSLSQPLTANLLKVLTRAKLLESVRGAGGGYRLAQPRFEISLAQILEAVEGPFRLVECAGAAEDHDHEACSLSGHCLSRSAMRVVHSRIANLMAQIQLPELIDHAHKLGHAPVQEQL
jgi:Rrf2 family protein